LPGLHSPRLTAPGGAWRRISAPILLPRSDIGRHGPDSAPSACRMNRRPLDPQSPSGYRWVSPSGAHWAPEQPKQWLGVADCRLMSAHVGSRNGSPWSDARPGEPGSVVLRGAHLLPAGRLAFGLSWTRCRWRSAQSVGS
jgi:hypothetical protein